MTLRQFGRIVELRTKVISLSSLLLGTLYAVRAGAFSPPRLLLMGVAVLAVDMGTTAFNSYYGFRHGEDDPRFNRETDKVLVHGGVSPGAALLVSAALYVLALFYGFGLAVVAGWPVAVVGPLGMLVGFLYNAGPRPISRTPFGELFAGGFLGFALFLLSAWVQAGSLPPGAPLAALPSFLLVASVLTVNNTCDLEGDRAAGRRTLSSLLGRRASAVLVVLLGAAAWGLAIVLRADGAGTPAPWWPLAAGAVLAAAEYTRLFRRGFSHSTKGPAMRGIVRVVVLYSLAAGLSLLLA